MGETEYLEMLLSLAGKSKLSHALASLKCCNIVKVRQKGKQRIYFLNKTTIVPMLELIDKHEKTFCKNCPMKK